MSGRHSSSSTRSFIWLFLLIILIVVLVWIFAGRRSGGDECIRYAIAEVTEVVKCVTSAVTTTCEVKLSYTVNGTTYPVINPVTQQPDCILALINGEKVFPGYKLRIWVNIDRPDEPHQCVQSRNNNGWWYFWIFLFVILVIYLLI